MEVLTCPGPESPESEDELLDEVTAAVAKATAAKHPVAVSESTESLRLSEASQPRG